MNYHDDELITPKWMDFAFYEKILINDIGDNSIKVNDMKVVPACQLGEHFASIIYRVNIKYSSKNRENLEQSLIVKTMPVAEGVIKDLLSQTPIFKTEIGMYSQTLPEMDKQLRFAGYNELTTIAPKCMYHSLEPNQIIAFEDVSKDGYRTPEKPLDYNGTKLVAEKLGRFHATSFYMNHNNGNVSDFKAGIFSEDSIDAKTIFIDNIKLFNQEISSWPEFENYSEIFNKFEQTIFVKCSELYKENKGGLNVLNHGDFHYKNLLFKFDENGDATDVMFIDFQLSVWASPAIDLIYLLYAIASNDVRAEHRDELIYLYYKEFQKTLIALGFMGTIPTLLDFHLELLKNGFFEMFLTTTMLLFLYIDFKNIDIDLTKLFEKNDESEAIKRKMYNIPFYVEEVKKSVPAFLHKGFI